MITPDFGTAPTTSRREVPDPITDLLRQHARELIAVALEAEVRDFMQELRAEGVDVVRNGYLAERQFTTTASEQAGLTVLHYDGDFDVIAKATGQRCEWVVPAETVD